MEFVPEKLTLIVRDDSEPLYVYGPLVIEREHWPTTGNMETVVREAMTPQEIVNERWSKLANMDNLPAWIVRKSED